MNPFTEALQKLAGQTLRPAPLSSSEWADVPAALRDRAFFSARVTNAQYLQDIKDRVQAILNPRTETREDGSPVTRGLDLPSARAELKQILQKIGYQPGEKAGTIEDLSSDRRIELQIKMNVEGAQGFGQWLQSQSEGALDAYPAQELYRAEDREEPRDWPTRWMQAGGEIFDGRMVALKTDQIWERISAFRKPWPPYDYASGMWVRPVSREDAISLGLLGEDEVVEPVAVPRFNEGLEASARGLDADLLKSLQSTIGNQVVVTGDSIRWKD